MKSDIRTERLAHLIFSPSSAFGASVWYVMITIVMTWPLVAGLTRDLPADLGDPLLNCWILGWGADHLLRFLTGDFGAFRGFWDANIFHPAPLALAYSEHLMAQAVQILPIYAFTRNLILCYNLVFLSTFVLSALGTYLLVRELTGDSTAAFLAGLMYGFAPYRVAQFSHVQVMSSEWMPFVLFGLRRYFDKRRAWSLAGAALALVAQNLSCGYYLIYFSPFAAAYALYEIFDRGLLRDVRLWRALALAGACVAAVTWPFLQPYLDLRYTDFPARSLEEVQVYAANAYSYFTAAGALRVWGPIVRAFPKPEGDLFPGFVAASLAAVGLGFGAHRAWKETAGFIEPRVQWRRLACFAAGVVIVGLLLTVIVLVTGGFTVSFGPVSLRVRSYARTLQAAAVALVALVAISRRGRAFLRGVRGSVVGYYALAALAAFWLSLGPKVTIGTRVQGAGPYLWLYRYVPGFDGLRVPARFGMLVMLFLTVLAAYGAAELARRWRWGRRAILVAGLLVLVESVPAPIELNANDLPDGLTPPPARVYSGSRVPEVYQFARELPDTAAIAEFPFGADAYELRYVYYSTVHWHPILNGFSGGYPLSYVRLCVVLRRPLEDRARAWRALIGAGATHAIVHEDAFVGEEGMAVRDWLQTQGARLVARFGPDSLLELPAATAGGGVDRR